MLTNLRYTLTVHRIKSVLRLIKTYSLNNISALLLFIIAVSVSIANYTPNTFLTGWDTLHPEFNYKIYWERMLGGVWQEHQGLGAVATQAHISEIPRVIILMLLDLILSTSQIRYAYAFLMYIIGPLGVYFFLKRLVFKNFDNLSKDLGSFAGALFYMFNLGILQHFYVPLEMFLTHFGFLGWIFLTAGIYMESPTRKNLLWFVFISFISASQAHTSTLFYALIIVLYLYIGSITVISKFKNLRVSLVLMVTVLFVNSFWFLPNIYFAVNHGKEIQQSKIHQLFSEEAFLQNKEFGDFRDVMIIRNFLFNWGEHVGNAEFGDLLDEWKIHQTRPLILVLGYAFFVVLLIGLVISLIKRQKQALAILPIFLVSIFFLMNVNPPLGFLFAFLQEYIPLFKEAFRFPFTKFSISLAFSYSVFFSYAVVYLASFLTKYFRLTEVKSGFLYVLILAGFTYYMFPVFNGHLISPSMRVSIPQRYFELFDYLNQQDEYGRIADFPIHSFWGWVYYNWNPRTSLGYQGAGFLWFGLKQPLLDREFDRWNLLNEQYYREMSYAVYSENPALLEGTLEKYKVKWMILDESVIAPGNNPNVLFYPELKNMFGESSNIVVEKDFGSGLKLYKFNPAEKYSLIEVHDKYREAGINIFKEPKDVFYNSESVYISSDKEVYPYTGITELDESVRRSIITADNETISIDFRDGKSLSPSITDYFQFGVFAKLENGLVKVILRDISGIFGNKEIQFDVPIQQGLILRISDKVFSLDRVNSTDYKDFGTVLLNPSEGAQLYLYRLTTNLVQPSSYIAQLEPCSDLAEKASYTLQPLPDGFKLSSKGVQACATFPLPEIPVRADSEDVLVYLNIETLSNGSLPDVCVFDSLSGLCKNYPLSGTETYAILKEDIQNEHYIRFFTNSLLSKEEVGVEYKNIYINFPQLISRDLLSLSDTFMFDSSTTDTRINVRKEFSLDIVNIRHDARICNTGKYDFYKSAVEVVNQEYISYRASGDALCDSFYFPTLTHKTGYILEIQARNLEGLPLRVCLTNEYSKRCDLYVSLNGGETRDELFNTQYFLIPPMGNGYGFTVNVSSLVFGKSGSKNDLKSISMSPVPYNFIRSLNKGDEVKDGKLLVYNQAYEKGWVALCGTFKLCSANHVIANGWANGWVLDPSEDLDKVKVAFWPELLEILGFGILISTVAAIYLKNSRKSDQAHSLDNIDIIG